MSDRIAKLEEKARLAREKLEHAKQTVAARERVADNKRKILLGALLQHLIEEDRTGALKARTYEQLDTFLTRNQDRRYFGLSLRSEDAAGAAVSGEGTVDNAAEG